MNNVKILGLDYMNSIKICGLDYKINYIDDNSRTDVCMGRCDTKMLEINISAGMPIQNRELTIVHEVVHIISETLGLGMTEKQVMAVSASLYPVILDIAACKTFTGSVPKPRVANYG